MKRYPTTRIPTPTRSFARDATLTVGDDPGDARPSEPDLSAESDGRISNMCLKTRVNSEPPKLTLPLKAS